MSAGSPRSQSSDITQHENELREELVGLGERVAADWASANLAVVIRLAGEAEWANAVTAVRPRAIMLIALRLFRAVRATMAVLGAGWEIEGRAMVRLVIETRARLLEVAGDASDETGRRWLEGKPLTTIRSAVRQTAPELDDEMAKALYGSLSQDAHADVGSVMRSMAQVDDELRATVTWGPQRTIDTRLSLLLCAAFAGEAATLLAVEAGVAHPNHDALARFIAHTEAALQADARES